MAGYSAPTLDLTALHLPTDELSLGIIRRRIPELFASYDALHEQRLGNLDIIVTMYAEVELAQMAFAKALGRPDPNPSVSRNELISELNTEYKRYGLSTGIEKTKQLARDIERAAREQAQRYRGR